ncbi:ribbon-helix-helix protein, CopG family [Wielerella bovis]|uniref:ribbon-helix-helix protein, CopG family n=1 Tax=Wielerella bovis TaxID=2917790 RepID=UPI0020190502|nr:ribbon-helix-helix protein, CopG family [Wielerella bovis]MCG7657138.1 ribbon-helix-helix protein, CopG family [Wielerella bovis]MCG7659361.1 ribbon-helix-helix protein, CopG family [Wielerella bovis]ULJ64040.1 ribbon-helix-helix protein, CopG family [Wielerella bovis]ULJ67497.1 ribbon-helix-helix protein, CopG family [Wielerella bovis]
MAMSQVERSKKYHEKHGIVQKKFNLDPETVALLERLAQERGESQTAVLKAALAALAEK